MNLTPKQRIKIIQKLTKRVIDKGKDHGLLFLEEYIKDKYKSSHYAHYAYPTKKSTLIEFLYSNILQFIQKLDNETIYKMYKDEFPEETEVEFSKKEKTSYHLSTDKLVLFFSHSKNVNLILNIKNALEKTDWIECFVAHKDIKPPKEWEKEIKKYLKCCHCLIAFLSKDFKCSPYCDQELGFAVHRQIPVFPVKLDNTDPYGFVQHIQATTFNSNKDVETLSSKIENWLLDKKENPELYSTAQSKLKKAGQTLTNNFLNSTNIQMAESVLDQLMAFKAGQIAGHYISQIQKNWKQNSKIQEVKGVDRKMKDFFKKHLKQVSKNEQNSHQKNTSKNKEQSDTANKPQNNTKKNEKTDTSF